MRDFLALQQFIPVEQDTEKRCIWCQKELPRNKAHIISKKITITSHASTILRYSVCKECNSKCSEIEKWILRYSPLGWLRFFYYFQSNVSSNTNNIPSYFYAEDIGEWLIYKIEGNRSTRTINSQLILFKEGDLKLITEDAPEQELDKILRSIRNRKFASDIKATFPEGFSPRALVDNEIVIVIARDNNELESFLKAVQDSELQQQEKQWIQPINSGQNRQHFKWSSENWLKFCTKTAYETLCLFEGAERCLKPEFDRVRAYVLAGVSEKYQELVFDEHGPASEKDTPVSLRVDLSVGQNCPEYLSALLVNVAPGMHSIAIYEIQGWICSSVAISGLPPVFLVLGGPNVHLNDLYILIYDEEVDEFDTVRLAYDQSKPVIPLPIQGGMREAIAQTYRLRPEQME